jgi:hypothetical protein
VDRGLRYFGGAVAFGFAAVWITWSLAAALVCLLSAAAGYGAVFVAQCARGKLAARPSMPTLARRTPEAEDLSLRADALNQDLGHVYEPTVTTHRPATQSPPVDDAASPSETPRQE